MDSDIIGQSSVGQTVNANRFSGVYSMGSSFGTNAAQGGENVMPCAGTLKNFYLNCDAGPGAGITRTFTVQLNGVDTSMTISQTGAGTGAGVSTGNDTTHTVSFAAGDTLGIRTSGAGGASTTSTGTIRWTFGANAAANTSMLLATGSANLATAANSWGVVHGMGTDTVSANNVEAVIPSAGTLKNAYVILSGTPAGVGKTYAFTLFQNGISTGITMSVTNTATTANDTTHTLSVAAGDRLYWQIVPTGTPTARQYQVSLEFDPTTNGESVHMYGSGLTQVNSAQRFQPLSANGAVALSSTEAPREALTQACTWKNLYVYEQTALSAGTYQYQLDKNGTAGNPSVTISSASQTGNDTVNTVTTAVADTVSMSITPASTPTAVAAEWGIVSYIAPPAGSTTVPMLSLTGAGL